MAKRNGFSAFVFLVPILVIIGAGVYFMTTQKAFPVEACVADDLSGIPETNPKKAFFEGQEIVAPQLAAKDNLRVLGVAAFTDRWVEVDLSEQKLRAWDGSTLFLESLVSTGLPWWPTPRGEFRVGYKTRAAKMEGGTGRNYYYLPNVPYIMFFGNEQLSWSRGYGLHGTYWHNDFGRQKSHGCVNLPTEVAKQLYFWTSPVVPEGKGYTASSPENPGTRVVIHE